jgi:hypothetical protein
VFTFSGTRDGIARIAEHLDATVEDGRLDALFVADEPAARP